MLTIFRRHLAECKFRTRKYKNCQCPLWVQGVLDGRKIRKSLDLRNWEAAQRLVRDWEANPSGGAVTISEACDKFIADAIARNVSQAIVRKIRHLTSELKNALGPVSLRSVSVDDVRKIREGWNLAPLTTQKRLEMLRSIFRFCVDSGWIDRNPAKGVRLPIVKHKSTLPFTDQEMKKIFWAADPIREIHYQMNEGIEKKMRALILLMRYSGLRISDAVTLTRSRIKEGKLFLYQAKTDEPVWVPLPEIVLKALEEIAEPGKPYYFWTGRSKLQHAPTKWQERLRKLFVIAGIPSGHSHRFRDTFAVSLLEKGVPLETVSMLLGHTSIKTTEKHYAPWVKSRQEALEAAVTAALK